MNPITNLIYLLSEDGIEDLRSRFGPPQHAFSVEHDQVKDTYNYSFLTYPDNKEVEHVISFPVFLRSHIEALLKNASTYMDERVLSMDSASDRKEFTQIVLNKLDSAINHWFSLPSTSSQYVDTIIVLESFKAQIQNQLAPFLDTNPAQEKNKIEGRIQNLPEGFKLRDHNLKAGRLNFRQTALLFDYLREYGAIIDYGDKPLAEFIHLLTGHSSQSLRGNGFGKIGYIKDGLNEEGEPKKERNKELHSLTQLLQSIIEDLNKEMAENTKQSK
ncbi:hypothetical protein ACFSC6_15250 [Rufibacter sediminis]|uniref:Uncharacterized protein n=1 Tax=Rufibacter sediminis TaxID=2762756 RepID=A0ABR6VW70_9BACT|nr:hypothetical protein [Rufibacter sediminis]MBC3541391.1 hypothetical protein [Rufibacter sediminis]